MSGATPLKPVVRIKAPLDHLLMIMFESGSVQVNTLDNKTMKLMCWSCEAKPTLYPLNSARNQDPEWFLKSDYPLAASSTIQVLRDSDRDPIMFHSPSRELWVMVTGLPWAGPERSSPHKLIYCRSCKLLNPTGWAFRKV